MFNINCEVWGGVTGYRQGLLKNEGKIVTFKTYDEAFTEAARLTQQMNGGYRTATFAYTAQPA